MNPPGLPIPILDDRRFQDLVDEALRFASQRVPEWTSREPGDPGVMMVEILAWMVDQLLYRLNQVPDAMYSHFLNMVGVAPRPAGTATVLVDVYLAHPLGVSSGPLDVTIPAGTRIGTISRQDEDGVVFSTIGEPAARPVRLVAVLTGDGEPPAVPSEIAGDVDVGPETEHVALALDRPAPDSIVMVDLQVDRHDSETWCTWECSTRGGWAPVAVRDGVASQRVVSGHTILAVPGTHDVIRYAGRDEAWLRLCLHKAGDLPRSRFSITALDVATAGVTVEAVHRRPIEREEVGTGNGAPGQRFGLEHVPVVPTGTEKVTVDGERWVVVDTLDGSSGDDRHVELDASTGQLRFGDGVNGCVPARGAGIEASYWTGGGSAGNVAAHTLHVLLDTIPYVARLDNPVAASGGHDAESVEDARRRAPLVLRSTGRAVTAEDFEQLALEADPSIARARCLPPTASGGDARLLLVPHVPRDRMDLSVADLAPRMSQVAEHIDARRLIGSRVTIQPARYQGVHIAASLLASGDHDEVATAAALAIWRYLHPVHGWRSGQGWPFGRPVVSGELFAALLEVRGVDLVREVHVLPWDLASGELGDPMARLDLGEDTLVLPSRPTIAVS